MKRNRYNNNKPKSKKTTNNLRSTDIMPLSITRTLEFVDSSYVRNNPGNNFLVYSFRVNDLFDPDPAILSGSVSGFKELMQFYNYYRVTSIDYCLEVSNNEAFALMIGICFSQTNLTGVIGTRDDAMNALENSFATRPHMIAGKGGIDKNTIRVSLKLSDLLGDAKQYLADTNYTGVGLSSPSIPLWMNVIVCSPTGAVLANGYTNTSTLTYHAQFFGRLNLRA